MRRTSLRNIELDRTNLTAYLLLNGKLKCLARSRQILMSENVDRSALRSLADIASVGISQAFRDGNNHIRMLFKSRSDIIHKSVHVKCSFGKVYKVGSYPVYNTSDSRSRSEPARVSSHDLYYRDRLYGIYRAITYDLLHGNGNILCRRTEAGGMVGSHKVVVYCFRNSDNTHFVIVALKILAQLRHCIHRVVAADVEEIAYIVLFEDSDKLFEHRIVLADPRELFTA